jgi:hypothetical protein
MLQPLEVPRELKAAGLGLLCELREPELAGRTQPLAGRRCGDGAVVGEGDAIAIFVNRTDQKAVRRRQGESLAGWSLTSVQPREVTLKQGDRSDVLALQRPDGTTPPSGPPAVPAAPAEAGGELTVPTTANTSFASFVPRSTPKNGKPDALSATHPAP